MNHGSTTGGVPALDWPAFVRGLPPFLPCGRAPGRLVNDTPTSQDHRSLYWLIELKGTAEAETPLTGYLSQNACVYYSWSVQEHCRES